MSGEFGLQKGTRHTRAAVGVGDESSRHWVGGMKNKNDAALSTFPGLHFSFISRNQNCTDQRPVVDQRPRNLDSRPAMDHAGGNLIRLKFCK